MSVPVRVLIVDDDRAMANAAARTLGAAGYETRVVFSGEEALSSLLVFPADAVICDFHMPGMSGAEVLTELSRRAPTIARVLTSGSFDVDEMKPPAGCPPCTLVAKPWTKQGLVGALRRALRGVG